MKKKFLNALIEEHYVYAYAAAYHQVTGDHEAEGKCREALTAIRELAQAVGLKEGTDYEYYETTKTASGHEVTFHAWRAITKDKHHAVGGRDVEGGLKGCFLD